MSQIFEIVTSGAVPPAPLRRHLALSLPDCNFVVTEGYEDVPDPFPAVWVQLAETNDPDWPCVLHFYAFPENSRLGRYPDLRLAEALYDWFGVRSLCDTNGRVQGIDPYDPYWFLAWSGGDWHLADASDTPLMGPYTDGTTSFPGNQRVRLRQIVVLPVEGDEAK